MGIIFSSCLIVGVHWSLLAREGSWRNWATKKDDEKHGHQKKISTKEILNPSTAFCQVMYFESFHKTQMFCLKKKGQFRVPK